MSWSPSNQPVPYLVLRQVLRSHQVGDALSLLLLLCVSLRWRRRHIQRSKNTNLRYCVNNYLLNSCQSIKPVWQHVCKMVRKNGCGFWARPVSAIFSNISILYYLHVHYEIFDVVSHSNAVTQRGYLNFFGEQDTAWHRKYVVSAAVNVILYVKQILEHIRNIIIV